jgi:hypothetical protein
MDKQETNLSPQEKYAWLLPRPLRALLFTALACYGATELVLEVSQRDFEERLPAITLLIHDESENIYSIALINPQGVITSFPLEAGRIARDVDDRSVLVVEETAANGMAGGMSQDYAVADALTGEVVPVPGDIRVGNYKGFRLDQRRVVSARFDQTPNGEVDTYLDAPASGETIHHHFPPTPNLQRFLADRKNHSLDISSDGSAIIRFVENNSLESIFVAQDARHLEHSRSLLLTNSEKIYTKFSLDTERLMFLSFTHINEAGETEFLQTIWDIKSGPIDQTSSDLVCLQLDPDTIIYDGEMTRNGDLIFLARRQGAALAYIVSSDLLSVYEFELPGIVTNILQEDSISAQPILEIRQDNTVSYWEVSSERGLRELPLSYQLESDEKIVDSDMANLKNLKKSNFNHWKLLGISLTSWLLSKKRK